MSPFLSTSMRRRFSRSSSTRNTSNPQTPPTSFAQSTGGNGTSSIHSSNHAVTGPSSAASSTHRGNPISSGPQGSGAMGGTSLPNGAAIDSRPMSSATDQSFDFANKPVNNHSAMASTSASAMTMSAMPMSPSSIHSGHGAIGNLSRTDQIVLKYFWEYKFAENCKRDLHYLKFPFFPPHPSHKDLLPYCEIYHLVKTSPGATIISLGSVNGVYIGFELRTGSQLHIDMDDEWQNISHHRVQFKPFDNMIRDPVSDATFKTWPKPLTIEFLEEQYQKWCLDLTSLCWEGKEVRELGGSSNGSASGGMHGNGAAMGTVGHGSLQSPVGDGKRAF